MAEYHLHNGDCFKILPRLADDGVRVDAVITDPPYGIGVTKMTLGNGKYNIYRGASDWDVPPPKKCFDVMQQIANILVIWGGNYFANILPPSRCWLVWDKRTGSNSFADCELAWTNIDGVIKKITIPWVGANAKDTPRRYHPTQKPVALMAWIIERYVHANATILDPFMGSGTTGVACMQTGRNFIGIERDEGYFNIAEKRIEAAARQPLLLPTGRKLTPHATDRATHGENGGVKQTMLPLGDVPGDEPHGG